MIKQVKIVNQLREQKEQEDEYSLLISKENNDGIQCQIYIKQKRRHRYGNGGEEQQDRKEHDDEEELVCKACRQAIDFI